MNEKWMRATDSAAVTDAKRTPAAPTGEADRSGLGVEWPLSKFVSLDAADEFMWAGDTPVVPDSNYRGRVSGSFNNAACQFFTVGVNWKF